LSGLTLPESAARFADATWDDLAPYFEDLVERRRDPSDRRINRVYLTAVGKNFAAGIEDFRESVAREVLDGIDEAAIGAALDTLLRIKIRLADQNGVKLAEAPVPRDEEKVGVARI